MRRKFRPGDFVRFKHYGVRIHGVIVGFGRKHWKVVVLDAPKNNHERWTVPEVFLAKLNEQEITPQIAAAFMKWKHGVRT